MYEVFGTFFAGYNESETLTTVSGYVPFQYMAYRGNNGSSTNIRAIKTYNGIAVIWWLRSAYRSNVGSFGFVTVDGIRSTANTANALGVAPAFCL